MRYLAKDLLELAGVKLPANKSVLIAGLTINKPDHIINIQDAKSVDMLVEEKKYTATIPTTQSEAHVKNVLVVKEAILPKVAKPEEK
jgi:hypothetical protein